MDSRFQITSTPPEYTPIPGRVSKYADDLTPEAKEALWSPPELAVGYDPGRVYRFDRMNQTHKSIRIPSFMEDIISHISELHPEYRHASDFFRDACWHRIRYHLDHGGIPSTPLMESLLSVERSREEMQYQIKRAEGFDEAVKLYIEQNDWYALKIFIQEQRKLALDEREPWRSRLLEILAESERKVPASYVHPLREDSEPEHGPGWDEYDERDLYD